jgi:hypothetical protein
LRQPAALFPQQFHLFPLDLNIVIRMAEEGAAGQLANLHLDEPTGEMVRLVPPNHRIIYF